MDIPDQSLSVRAEEAGARLDALLAARDPGVSRSQWKALVECGAVRVNGAAARPDRKLKAGDAVAWRLPAPAAEGPEAEAIPLSILYEDAEVLVLNKQPGLVIHPAAGNRTGTLVNALLFRGPAASGLERAGIVHRLDKETSGAMVVAKTAQALAELKRQFKERETGKEYFALVWGAPPPRGRIENEIGRHPGHRQKRAVLAEGGRPAVSEYETVERFAGLALVRVGIETGRTHQIRVHMAHLGHPVVGDALYGRGGRRPLPLAPGRQMLHAARLAFTHPATGKRLSFEAPLYEDMRRLLEELRNEPCP